MRTARPAARLTRDSRLSGTILRMISTNSLAAFTQDVSRAAGIGQVQPVRTGGSSNGQSAPPQRALEAVPAAPATPLPRGSLLDLRV
ncbi:hypothetical protein SAMN02745194_01303 [Roseomonas rosea]|uniref:Uncharacterized protein n=1 Tax=Muricoccus roseus TaxID=198092 RepID=A0A1M6EVY6_9PROT|nr:hypothetical protein [Roseomonas rosea]SHI89664.1 hypothetical protein SAMN02745194_01303 [Roseomonas rosea]